MKIGIMQPYLFPYIGYFQLIKAVDVFIIHDDVQFIQRGWINRNRLLNNNADFLFSLPIKKAGSNTPINDIEWADSIQSEKKKLIGQIQNFYKKAPYFEAVFPIIQTILNNEEQNLSRFIYESIVLLNDFFKIKTKILVNSTLSNDKTLKAEERVIDIVRFCEGTHYINPIGGMELYDTTRFQAKGLELSFIKTQNVHYQQFKEPFVPFLSIVDVMMFNSEEQIEILLETFDFIKQ